ncbi:MAG: septum formation initiator family protein [Clostridia bacterium]|nr:septum formation initiator family protein [Clostridia bacterium]
MRKFETKQGRQARLKRQRRSNMIAMLAAIAIVFVLSIIVLNGRKSLETKGNEYESRRAELSQQIAQEESRSQSLEEYRKYVKTKKYVEEMAKNKFGLLYPDEIIFRSEGSDK